VYKQDCFTNCCHIIENQENERRIPQDELDNIDAMADNGSPEPIFETDGKTYTLATLKIHPSYQASYQASDQAGVQVGVQDNGLIISDMEVLSQLLKADFRDLGDQAGVQAEKVVEDHVHAKVHDIFRGCQ